jgi:hypothetical protein
MKKQDAVHAAERRRFLKGVAVAGGSTALASVFASRLLASEPEGTAARKLQQPGSRGYRETDHIREYYRTLRS